VDRQQTSGTIEFIPGPSDDVSFHDIKVQTKGDGSTTITFRVEPLSGHAMPSASVRCLVTVSNQPGRAPAGMAVDVPMASTSEKSPGKP
jgi:hypothetical protein